MVVSQTEKMSLSMEFVWTIYVHLPLSRETIFAVCGEHKCRSNELKHVFVSVGALMKAIMPPCF